jgi:hypothetical protein
VAPPSTLIACHCGVALEDVRIARGEHFGRHDVRTVSAISCEVGQMSEIDGLAVASS